MLTRTPEYLGDNFTAIRSKIETDTMGCMSVWQIVQSQANLDVRLEAGDTSLLLGAGAGSWSGGNVGSNSYSFNLVRPMLSMAGGYQRRNRKSSIVIPEENGDQHTADQLTRCLLNIFKRQNIYEIISDAFYDGALVTGLSLIQLYLDFQEDPINGELKATHLNIQRIMMDPFWRNPDLSDCSFVRCRTYMTHTAAAALMPSHYDEIMSLPGNPFGFSPDGYFQYMPEQSAATLQNLVAYDEYYYRTYRKQKLLVDKNTGEKLDVSNREDEVIKDFLNRNDTVELIEHMIPTVRLSILVQDKVLYDGPQPLNIDCYPFVTVTGYYSTMMPYFYNRIQGLCRSMRDAQLLLNRRIVLSNDLIESQLNSGWIAKEDAVIDNSLLFQTGQGRLILIKKGAQLTDVQPIQPPQIPPSYFQLQDTYKALLNQVTGINEELMGHNYDDKSGYRSALQQGAGLTTLQPLFDRLDNSQKALADLILEVIQKNYTPSKVRQLLGGEEPAPLFYDKAFGKYSSMVELGFNTESQKQMQFAQLLHLKEIGVQITDEQLIRAATLQNKDQIIEDMQQKQQQIQQMQMAQAQSAMQEQQARTELAKARAVADYGLGQERMSRIEENHALAEERKAQAVKDDLQAVMNFIKAAKEIQGIKLDQLFQVTELKNLINPPVQQETNKPTAPAAGS